MSATGFYCLWLFSSIRACDMRRLWSCFLWLHTPNSLPVDFHCVCSLEFGGYCCFFFFLTQLLDSLILSHVTWHFIILSSCLFCPFPFINMISMWWASVLCTDLWFCFPGKCFSEFAKMEILKGNFRSWHLCLYENTNKSELDVLLTEVSILIFIA